MKSCTILIFHHESFNFLVGCIREIRKYKNSNIEQHIIIADQSEVFTHRKINYTFSKDADITIARIPQIDSGYSIDWVLRNMNITTEYLCTLDCDAFPIHFNWLYVPIKLIEEEGYSFVGSNAGIDHLYKEHGDFFIMNQFYRVGKTEKYKTLSLEAGFVRYNDRSLTGLNYTEKEWEGYSDCGVVAHWHDDRNSEGNKLSLSKNKIIKSKNENKIFGIIVDDLVFHFSMSSNSKNVPDRIEKFGPQYTKWIEKIEVDGFTPEIIDSLISLIENVSDDISVRTLWDGKIKISKELPADINSKIENYKTVKSNLTKNETTKIFRHFH